METKLEENNVNRIANLLPFTNGFEVPMIGLGRSLMLLWNNELSLSILSSSSNHIGCSISLGSDFRLHFSGFYGHSKTNQRNFTSNFMMFHL